MTSCHGSRGELEWSVCERPLPGETRSGDAYLAISTDDRTLLVVIDALGHGPEANETARRLAAAFSSAARALEGDSSGVPLEALFKRCHAAMHGNRGAVMTVAAIQADGSLEWAGVGNVEGVIVHGGDGDGHVHMLQRPGVLGIGLPSLRPETIQLQPGDVVVLATDGVRSQFLQSVDSRRPVEQIASCILQESARAADDALVLVARYGEAAP